MRAIDRLAELKEEAEDSTPAEQFVSIISPRNSILMECVVAWTCIEVRFMGDEEVDEKSTMRDMWRLCEISMSEFASTAGIDISEAVTKTQQMANLGLVYPDGTANSKAIGIVRAYISGKVRKF